MVAVEGRAGSKDTSAMRDGIGMKEATGRALQADDDCRRTTQEQTRTPCALQSRRRRASTPKTEHGGVATVGSL